MKNSLVHSLNSLCDKYLRASTPGAFIFLILAVCLGLFAACEPFFPEPVEPRSSKPLLQTIPLRSDFAAGDRFDPAADIAVYRQQEDGSGMIPLSFNDGDFLVTLTDPDSRPLDLTGSCTLDAPGSWTVAVLSADKSVAAKEFTLTVRTADIYNPLVQVIPFKTVYAIGDSIDTAKDLAVYTRDLTTGGMTKRSISDFTVAPTSFSAAGSGPVTVTVNDYPAPNTAQYTVWVGDTPPSFSPLVQVIPSKTAYTVGDSIDPDNDLAVYTRDLTTGGMTKRSSGGFTVNPTSFSAAGSTPVTVTVNGYPAPNTDSTDWYNVLVATSFSPLVQVIPFKTAYAAGENINPANDLAVYTRDLTTGEMTRKMSNFTVNPTSFSAGASGSTSVTVTVNGYPAPNTAQYTVWVTSRQTMNITYVDDTPGKMELNANGEWVVTAPQNKVIKTFTTNTQAGGTGQTYLMGRVDDMPIKLNIDSAGTLGFRPPDADGIPIGTVEEFQMINKNQTTRARKYYQEDDLDLMGNLGNQWAPIGRFWDSFTGVFDGRGYSIDNIYVVEADRGAGLFGHINGNAKLQNIHIKSGSVTGWTDVGGIVGSQWDNNQNTTILNCSNAASVTQTDTGILGKAGGITGGNMAGGMVIIACKNEGAVSGNWHVGGIAGGGDANFTIISCYNTGDITGVEYVGGIVGSQAAGQLRACYNQGSVNEPPSWHSPYGGGGGVLGYGSVAVTNCYWNSEAQNSAGTKTEAFDNGRGIPYDGSVNGPGFPDVSAVSGWETSTNGANGYWKPGTTSGGIKHGPDAAVNLPRLWWE